MLQLERKSSDQRSWLPKPVLITDQKWPHETVPVVSVCCLTYNHERFIRECLDGFLMQKTSFPVEILIHDDASGDGTAEIIREYAVQCPHIIKPILQLTNQYSNGIKPFAAFVIPVARGGFIALCEGDDYWTDPYKLEKQVQFLEENTDFSICFHKVKISSKSKIIDDYITRNVPVVTDIIELARGNYMHTPSVVFRRHWLTLPDWFYNCPIDDYPLHMINAEYGKIYKLDDVMCIYRVHDTNTWANQHPDNMRLKILAYLEAMIGNFQDVVNDLLIQRYEQIALDLAREYYNSGDLSKSSKLLIKAMQMAPISITKKFFGSNVPVVSQGRAEKTRARILKIIKSILPSS